MAWRRRRVLASGAAAVATIAGCSVPSQPTTGRDGPIGDAWPLWRRDPGRTGFNPHAPGPVEGREAWSVETAPGTGPPVVADGTVYVGSNALAAFDAATGDRRWHRPVSFPAIAAPAVGEETVYAVTKGGLYALAPETGADRWIDTDAIWRYHAPVVTGKRLYVGSTKVKFSTDFEARVVSFDGQGSMRWKTRVGRHILPPFTPAVADDRVFVGRDAVYALSTDDGDVEWQATASNVSAFGDPVVAEGSVYAVGIRPVDSGPPEGIVLSLAAATGQERWRVETGLSPSPPAVAEGTVYVTADKVLALDAADGSEQWTLDDARYVTAAPSVTRSTVYLTGVNGSIRAVARTTGETRFRLPLATAPLSAPALVGQRLFVTALDGRVVALGPSASGEG